MTMRWDYLYIRRKFREQSGVTWLLRTRDQNVDYRADGAAVSDQPVPKAISPAHVGSAAAAAGDSAATSAVDSSAGSAKVKEEHVEGKAEKAEKSKAVISAQEWNKLKGLKKRFSAALTTVQEIQGRVQAKDEAWSWVEGSNIAQKWKKSIDELDVFKKSNAFWSSWTMEENFSRYAGRTFKAPDLKKYMGETQQLESKIASLEVENKKLLAMNAAYRA